MLTILNFALLGLKALLAFLGLERFFSRSSPQDVDAREAKAVENAPTDAAELKSTLDNGEL